MTDQPSDTDDLIPATPTAEDYAEEAKAQEAFGVEDDQGDVFGEEQDPLTILSDWLKLARKHEINDPNAMCVASVDRDGSPDARMVLLKELDHGLTFYTNMQSAKGEQLLHNPACTALFHWKSIRRQVRLRGQAVPLSDKEADDYFARRDRGSRIGAWASQQSRPMSEPDILKTRIDDFESLFEDREVPRPEWWRGFRIVPRSVEFWVNRPFRLHDRKRFTREGDEWVTEILYP
ncbi:pyridoxamine 5'-phosphate oxidase [Parvularcula maris]|uniref:Pyridoxine/pyridoxamine 5'-phosphate oxidase n=1 Tax=Parvularcula maris TaxID=2965077 RepID=A0A9X2RI42_9PROT|nr:pyridoxamine 5'-phosphate oxidase [Parvularcula maris]MCQ8185564.1 pyridoxamine 5'-phosphate oxidase [Parvularcula maris]